MRASTAGSSMISVVDMVLRKKPISSRSRACIWALSTYIKGVVLFLRVMHDYPTPTIDPLTFEGP